MKKQKFEFDTIKMMDEKQDVLLGIIDSKDSIIQDLEEQLVLRDNYIESIEESYRLLKEMLNKQI